MKRNTAYISVGSNIGEGVENCRRAVAYLGVDGQVEVTGHSRFFMTEPVGYTDQPWFVNVAIRIATDLEPGSLLERLKTAERSLGRSGDGIRFGPRVIDLDIVLFNDIVMETPELILPHPRMHQRRFVLLPLCDIDPEKIHPCLGTSIRRLLETLPAEAQECRPLEE